MLINFCWSIPAKSSEVVNRQQESKKLLSGMIIKGRACTEVLKACTMMLMPFLRQI